MPTTLIMKFGGTAVGMTTGLTQLLSIVLNERPHWKRLLLVVSALEGVTDVLIETSHLAEMSNRRGYRRNVATLRTRHLALISHLPLGDSERSALEADLDRLLFDMLDLCENLSDKVYTDQTQVDAAIDAIVGVGERLAARIVAALLRQNSLRSVAIDATDLIVTDSTYGNAVPNMQQTREHIQHQLVPMLDRNITPVITGFIGMSDTGKPTTLGRGGSDYTASILGACTNANEVWIWTDVDGMMTADPREVPNAVVIPTLSYAEVAELAYFGARILHQRMIKPLQESRIRLRVKNTFKPALTGTLIEDLAERSAKSFKAVTSTQGIGLTASTNGSLNNITTLVNDCLYFLTGSHIEVLFTTQSATSTFTCYVIPTSAGLDATRDLQVELQRRLSEAGLDTTWRVHPVAIVTAIGSLDNTVNHKPLVQLLNALEAVPLLTFGLNPSGTSISLVTEFNYADVTLETIHNMILSS